MGEDVEEVDMVIKIGGTALRYQCLAMPFMGTQCGHENRNDRKFCEECGSPLRDYTKPRENLIMPNDIKNEQLTEKKTKTVKIYTTICSIILVMAVIFTALSFCFKNELRKAFAIVSIVLFVAFFIVAAIKKRKVKKINSQIKED